MHQVDLCQGLWKRSGRLCPDKAQPWEPFQVNSGWLRAQLSFSFWWVENQHPSWQPLSGLAVSVTTLPQAFLSACNRVSRLSITSAFNKAPSPFLGTHTAVPAHYLSPLVRFTGLITMYHCFVYFHFPLFNPCPRPSPPTMCADALSPSNCPSCS